MVRHLIVFIFGICTFIASNVNCFNNDTNNLDKYLIVADVAIDKFPEENVHQFERNISKLFCAVFERATNERLGQSITRFDRIPLNFSVDLCSMVDIRQEKAYVELIFIVNYNGAPVDGAIATKEISRLTYSHLSAAVGYPIVLIHALDRYAQGPSFQWWIVLIIIGSCLLFCFCGWLLMFIYYNTCNRPMGTNADVYRKHDIETKISIEKKSAQTQSDPVSTPPLINEPCIETELPVQSEPQITRDPITIDSKPYETSDEMLNNQNVKSVEFIPSAPTVRDSVPTTTKPRASSASSSTFPIADPWSPYHAGDRIAAILQDQELNSWIQN
ncbi:hypothetical protein M3Y95_01196700 [Aphelenchoides besseyi]|nr:hypothetical protein M3Y95_01196700 [Aphelenchoides besseyi]